jgi:GT2 family glycosyltransferase
VSVAPLALSEALARPTTQLSGRPDVDPVSRCDCVIVLSYFGRQDTMRCIDSLVSGSPSARLLVIDNGTFDGVLEAARSRWPQVETIQTGSNLGFSGGMNVGLTWAHSIGADTITVLNNDTIIPPGVIDALATTALQGGAVSPEVRYADAEQRVWFGGGVVDTATNLPRHLNDEEIAEKFADTPKLDLHVVETLAGCCITATAVTWLRVGPIPST